MSLSQRIGQLGFEIVVIIMRELTGKLSYNSLAELLMWLLALSLSITVTYPAVKLQISGALLSSFN